MSPGNKKPGQRRLANMGVVPAPQHWAPPLPSVDDWEQHFPISDTAQYLLKYGHDERNQLADWAVVQERLIDDRWCRVAVYDICHDKGVHRHLYDRDEVEFDETPLRPINCYRDMEDGLEYALGAVVERWEENERRSDNGC